MKRKIYGMIITLLAAFSLVTTAYAADYGVIYDETELLGTDAVHVSNAPYVLDYTNILTNDEEALLIEEADKQAQQHQFGFYIVTIEDYQQYTDGSVQDAAEYIYTQYGMGIGEEKDGLLLLLSTKDRDYSLLTHGTYGNYAFSQYAREKLQEFFLDDFGADNMFAGFMDYLVIGGEFLTVAEEGTPYSGENPLITEEEIQENIAFGLGIIFGVPLIVAGIVIFILSGKMKSVAVAAKASDYVSGEVELTEKADHFSHVTTVRTKKEQQSSSSNSSSGGFSGTSGKY